MAACSVRLFFNAHASEITADPLAQYIVVVNIYLTSYVIRHPGRKWSETEIKEAENDLVPKYSLLTLLTYFLFSL